MYYINICYIICNLRTKPCGNVCFKFYLLGCKLTKFAYYVCLTWDIFILDGILEFGDFTQMRVIRFYSNNNMIIDIGQNKPK